MNIPNAVKTSFCLMVHGSRPVMSAHSYPAEELSQIKAQRVVQRSF